MKIYNEIVIDMNPESSSYGETLHEDSFDYNGDMMLMQGGEEGQKIIVGNPVSGDDKSSYMYQTYVYSDGKWVQSGLISWQDWEDRGGYGGEISHYTTLADAPKGEFSYSSSGFDPTSAEFKTSVEETKGFGELAAGFGMEEGDFEEFYGKPLDFMKEEYGEEGTLAQGRALDLSTAKEGMRAATATQRIGQEAAGLKAGQSLTDIYTATSAQQEKGGFGPGGATSAISSRATRGVMGDYNLQQKQLAEGMTQAKTAFDISTDRIDLAETQADIDYRRDQSEFWKAEEDKFYDRLMYLESQG